MQLDLIITGLSVLSSGGRRLLWVPDLAIKSGTLVGIKGPSGAGKSTFLHSIAGIDDAATGHVVWGDTDILSLPDSARDEFRRQHIGLVFRNFMLFNELSALENASLAAMFSPSQQRAEIRRNALSLLARLGLPTVPGPTETLSAGEKQLVALARAHAVGASVILADEPTAHLDQAAAIRLGQDLVDRSRRGGRTLICATHDLDLLAQMDRVLALRDGLIQEEAIA